MGKQEMEEGNVRENATGKEKQRSAAGCGVLKNQERAGTGTCPYRTVILVGNL